MQVSYSVGTEERRKVVCGKLREEIGIILRRLCEYKSVKLLEEKAYIGHLILVQIKFLRRALIWYKRVGMKNLLPKGGLINEQILQHI